MQRSRVFVTGLGVVSPHGNDAEEMFERLLRGESAIRKVTRADDGSDSGVLIASAQIDPAALAPKSQLLLTDRVAQLALGAAQAALRQAGMLEDSGLHARTGVYFGCGLGGAQTLQDAYRIYYERHSRKLKPTTVPLVMASAPAAHISIRYRLTGPSHTYSIACASSAVAIGEAFRALRDGYLDQAVAGGAEAMLNDGSITAWEALGVLAKEHPSGAHASSRPFARDRSGFVLGEGAAAIVMEREDVMRARGARPLVEIVGYGAASDASGLTQPAAGGQTQAMQVAIEDARVDPSCIGYINAHATATPTGDLVEIEAIKHAFGVHAHRLAISSTKSMHGHLVGAAGALEFVITALALARGWIPPTAHLDDPDPACDLDCVPLHARPMRDLEYAMSNSFAFGGANASLIARRA